MKKLITFNTLYDENRIIESVKTTDVKHMTLSDIKLFPFDKVDQNYWPAIQMFNTSTRVSKIDANPEQWQFWTGCAFVDIDLKHLPEDLIPNKSIEFVRVNINSALQADNNLYFTQLSKSEKGLHYVFYFDVEKTHDNFQFCAITAKDRIWNAIRQKLPELANDIANHDKSNPNKKIMDDCSLKPVQLLVMTSHPLYKGQNVDAENFGHFDLNVTSRIATHQPHNNGLTRENTTFDSSNVHWNNDYGNIHWGELECYQLAAYLSFCVTEQVAHDIFQQMFRQGYYGRKSSWHTIEKEFRTAFRGKNDLSKTPQAIIEFCEKNLNINHYDKVASEKSMTCEITEEQAQFNVFLENHKNHQWDTESFRHTHYK